MSAAPIRRWREDVQGRLDQMKFLVELAADPEIVKALQAIDCLCDEAIALRNRAVQEARTQAVTWEEIGVALGGMSRQAAWDRFRHVEANNHLACTPPQVSSA